MSTPNPLVPQGSLLEQQAKSKSTFQVAAFIVALHVVILGGLLFLGCKKEEKLGEASPVDSLIPPPAVAGDADAVPPDPFAMPTNAVAFIPDSGTVGQPPMHATIVQPTFQVPQTDVVPAPTPGLSEYVVQKGDIAYNIAKKQGLTLKQLQEANSGTDLAKLKVSQKLQIPAAGASPQVPSSGTLSNSSGPASEGGQAIHTVKGGDNLSRLAKKYGISVKEIRNANGLKSNDIKVGQKLKIPGGSGGATAPATDASGIPSVIPAQPLRP